MMFKDHTDKELQRLRNMNIWYSDFETTTTKNYENDGEIRVYMWGLMSADGKEYYTGTDLIEYLYLINKVIVKNEKDKASVWFHNLKFDFSFIESHFLRNNVAQYRVQGDIAVSRSYGREYVTTRDDMGNLYGALWMLGNKRSLSFKDSAKVYPMTVDGLGKSVGLNKLSEDFDYEQYIPKLYKPTSTDWMYMYNDIEIVRRAMNREIVSNGFQERLTRTGYAFNGMKEMFITKFNEKQENNGAWGDVETFDFLEYGGEKNDTIFDIYFRPTPPKQYQMMSRAYFGGIVYTNLKTRNKEMGPGLALDVNSEYPAAMLKYDFPYKEPLLYEGSYDDLTPEFKEKHPLYIQYFKSKFKIKDDGFPCLPKSWGVNKKTVYSSDDVDTMRMETFALSSPDMYHFKKNFDIEYIEYEYGLAFEAIHAPFKDYIEYQAEMKIKCQEAGDKIGRQGHKLNMNGCYGKMAQKPDRSSQDSYLDENGVVRYSIRDNVPEAQQYFPMAIFTAAWARDILMDGIYKAGVDRVMYVDTDSIHLIGTDIPEGLEIHDTKLGAWSIDAEFVNCKFLRDKTYMEEVKNEDGSTYLDIKAAGLNDEAKAYIKSFKMFELGRAYKGVLVSKLVKGGTLLVKGQKYLTPMVIDKPHKSELKRHERYMAKIKDPE